MRARSLGDTMKYFYFWAVLLFLCDQDQVLGSGGPIPRRATDTFQSREQKAAATQKSYTVAKHTIRKHSSDGDKSSRRLFGRHVCSQNKVRMMPLKEMQSYCKPTYQSYIRRCDKDNTRYCTGYRVAYELAYRTVERMVAKTESQYSCCPGWTQTRDTASDCKKAVCREECKNGGICIKPDLCACLPGWTGRTCDLDVDECSRRNMSLCEQECVNTPGSYKCVCKEGFVLQSDRHSCKKEDSKKPSEQDEELIRKIDSMQKRINDLEEWRRSKVEEKSDDTTHHQRDDRINSLSEQIAILEERLEECTCNRRDDNRFLQSGK